MNLEPKRRIEHQQVIALLKEAKEPPADAETPNIPDEILERLRGQYGRTVRRAIVEEKPGFWASFLEMLVQPKFAFAAALVLLCGVSALVLRPSGSNEDLMRGGQVRPAAIPAYWVQSAAAEPAPTGLGMPKLLVLKASDALPAKGMAVILDPAHREARVMKEGVVLARIQITDPSDSNEWLAAHRELSKLPSP